jgi:hypothetical protein
MALVALGMLLVGSLATPAKGATGTLGFVRTPIGGPPGTDVSVEGVCIGSTEGDAYLERPATSDAILPPDDHEHFTVTNNTFEVSLQSPYGTAEGGHPTDARVRVTCGSFSVSKPFTGHNAPLGTTPSIFTALGEKPCGFGLGPSEADAALPCSPHIKGFDGSGALATTNFYRDFDLSNGPSIAIGDVDEDGQNDIVTGSGRGVAGSVVVYALDGTPKSAAFVYGEFAGGVNVAVGDIDNDGDNDIVTGARSGGGPHVLGLAFDEATNSWNVIRSFYAYAAGFTGGVNVAAGTNAIVTGAGPGGGPHVRRFDGNGNDVAGFYAYHPGFVGGVNVATPADGSHIVTGAGAGGGPHVVVFTANGAPVTGFYAYDPAFGGGVSVGSGRVAGQPRLVTGAGPGGGPHVRIFNTDGTLDNGGFYAYGPFGAGVRVAVAP